MSDDIWARDEVQSPCVKICVVHPAARICIVCLRSPDEIARWSRLSPDERRGILATLPDRAPMLRGQRKGRAARLKG